MQNSNTSLLEIVVHPNLWNYLLNPSIVSIIKNILWVGLALYIFCKLEPLLTILLKRISKIGFGDLFAELDNHNDNTATSKEAAQEGSQLANSFEMDKYHQNTTITDEQNMILNFIKDSNLSNNEKLRTLIKDLAKANVEIKMLYISQWLFNEQVSLLSTLNMQQPLHIDKLKIFYDAYDKNEIYQQKISYGNFINNLKQASLILIDESNHCLITNLGREYLAYRVNRGLPIVYD
ncbi:MAG: hypothetical protein KBD37_00850 [Burkholderiales bacterium]|nr:hypothetical protein [Burkholderiales bacterium]